MYLASKTMKYKPYSDLQLMLILIYRCKDLLIDFITRTLVSTNWKSKTYNSILIIVDQLIKIEYYKLVRIIINIPDLAKVFFNILVWHHDLPNSIVTNQESLFIFKFWSLLCYFLDIQRLFSTTLHLSTNGQMKWQNSIVEAYL